MRKLLITAVCAATTFPAVSAADDHGQASRSPSYQHDSGGHQYNTGGHYPYYVRNQHHYNYLSYPPYHYGHNHRDGNDDDALWAIGGLVVGAIIGNAVAHASTPPPATTSASSAGQPQQ